MKVIPLRHKTKRPCKPDWNRAWNGKAVINYFAQGTFNVGCLLGKVLDIEGDTEEANKFLNNLLADYPHPIYKSAKSYHHLFKNTYKIRHRTVHGIEFRGYDHQSVLPPSIHPSGAVYEWVDDNKLKIPDLPNILVEYMKLHGVIPKHRIPQAHPWCFNCKQKQKLTVYRFNKELRYFKFHKRNWVCRKCRDQRTREELKKFIRSKKS